jgi:hypothetical protein
MSSTYLRYCQLRLWSFLLSLLPAECHGEKPWRTHWVLPTQAVVQPKTPRAERTSELVSHTKNIHSVAETTTSVLASFSSMLLTGCRKTASPELEDVPDPSMYLLDLVRLLIRKNATMAATIKASAATLQQGENKFTRQH